MKSPEILRACTLALAAALMAAATDASEETEHLVTANETLSGIAVRSGVPMAEIADANGLSDPYVVKAGQTLIIPRQRSHVVKKGDNAFSIGFAYGLPFGQIALANAIAEDATLTPGQKLVIPMQSGARSAPEPVFRRPHEGQVLLGWQRRRDGRNHDGIDFALRTGDAVRAAAAGTVVFAGIGSARFGNIVVIDHGGGWQSAYGHLGHLTVARGDSVRTGERIGLGGQSGQADTPELHFEIRKDGQPVDPGPKLGLKQ